MTRLLVLSLLFAFATPALALPPTEKPLPPREAAAAMSVPEGFKVTLFAGEPDVSQPIAMCFDDRGRLWVAECYSYPKWIKKGEAGKPFEGEDRILIFEDTDNDGTFDKRTVFKDKLANLTSIEFGFGGIYALSSPYLIHIPIKPGADEPGEPKILLDGWSLDAGHNMVNGLKWGPDGWLYGCHGITATSHTGKPGTPKAERTPINCGVWRFHPITHKYEIVANGGTNPWGIDWDEQGELYFTNCVIDHAFHVIPGGHYQRMYGTDFNPHLYKLMPSACDHIHWGGGAWTSSRGGDGKHSEAGGGHAHSGCMIYLGDNFPKEYRNNLYTGNIHGNRLNRDRIDYTNKGPILRHEKDFLFGNDPWFRPIAMTYGPDGGVYVIDWTDTGECHNYQVVHKSGRIYKVVYGKPESKLYDRSTVNNTELFQLHDSSNEWNVRHARRILLERYSSGKLRPEEWGESLTEFFNRDAVRAKSLSPTEQGNFGATYRARSIRLLQTRMALQYADPSVGIARFGKANGLSDEVPIALIIRSFFEPTSPSAKLDELYKRNASLLDSIHARPGRLQVASLLQRFEPKDRWKVATSLSGNADDRDDTQLALMIWYAIQPLVELDATAAASLAAEAKIPLIREFIARRIASLPDADAAEMGTWALLREMTTKSDPEIHRDVLAGIQAGVQGNRNAKLPANWIIASVEFAKSPSIEVRDRALALGVIYGSKKSLADMRALVTDKKAELPRRQDALKSLVFKQPDDLHALLVDLLDDDALRSPAIRALAAFKDDAIASKLIGMYPKLAAAERNDVIATLSSRPAFAMALLDAVAQKKIDRKDLGPVEVRQLYALKDAAVASRVEEVWGTMRPAGKDKVALISKYKKLLGPEETKLADAARGRLLFTKHCAACHKLFGEGAAIGPDITGAQRQSLDYLLENILDPSAVVPREYQVHVVTTTTGRVITGIVKEDNDRALTLQTQNEVVVVPKAEIESRTSAKQSMMPDGILEQMSLEEARALFAYLGRQTALEKR